MLVSTVAGVAKVKNPTLQVLREIRAELNGTNRRLDATNEHLDGTNERLEATHQEVRALARRQPASEIRLSTELTALARVVGEVRDLLRDRLDLRDRVDDHERRILTLEGRTTS
jgi:hypothetical protein